MRIGAIIAAAGIGRRMGADRPKQYLEIADRPIICHTLDQFLGMADLIELVVVVEPGREESFRQEIIAAHAYPESWRVVAGGALRQESVANGLHALSDAVDIVLVHDGVRPFVTGALIARAAAAANETGAAIVAAPVTETIKRVQGGRVIETVDRNELWGAQTPQAARREILLQAMEAAQRDGFVGTDEMSLIERIGVSVAVVEGDRRNIKITSPEDLIIAEAIYKTVNREP